MLCFSTHAVTRSSAIAQFQWVRVFAASGRIALNRAFTQINSAVAAARCG